MVRRGEYTATERAGLLVWHLAHGEGIRALDAAVLTGLSVRGAQDMLCRLSRVVPIYRRNGVWQVCALSEIDDLM
jgi:hypothetical protein